MSYSQQVGSHALRETILPFVTRPTPTPSQQLLLGSLLDALELLLGVNLFHFGSYHEQSHVATNPSLLQCASKKVLLSNHQPLQDRGRRGRVLPFCLDEHWILETKHH